MARKADDKFTLVINLGNDAMRTRGDVARALKQVATVLSSESLYTRRIADDNGNTVGQWWFE